MRAVVFWRFRILWMALLLSLGSSQAYAQGPVNSLFIENDHFVVNGQAKFLFMVSYFDGMRSSSYVSDFATMASKGVDGVRIFANWNLCDPSCHQATDTLIDSGGNLRPARLAVLQSVLNAARNAGLVVDLTFARDTVSIGGGILSESLYKDGVVAAANAINSAQYPHVFFDLQNERDVNIGDGRFLSESDVLDLRNRVKMADPNRIVTASNSDFGGFDIFDAGPFRSAANLDVTAWHDDRSTGWQDRTAGVVQDLWYNDPWRPVYLQEPQRFDQDTDWTHYITAAVNAKFYGAAGWTLHNRPGMMLQNGWVLQGEGDVLDHINNQVRPYDWAACVFRLDRYAQNVGAGGGTFTVNITSRWYCSWAAFKNDPGASWVQFSGPTNGADHGGTVTFFVSPNGGGPRSTTLTIGTWTFTINQ
jgi:hypothetical protein